MSETAVARQSEERDDPLTPQFVRQVIDALDRGDGDQVRNLIAPMRPADIAELLDLMRTDERRALVEMLGPELKPEVLSELEEGVRDEVIALLDPGDIAQALAEMDSDDAVYLLEDLDQQGQQEILSQMPADERAALERALEYPEDSAGRLMQRHLVAVPPFWDVGHTIDYMREAEDLPDEFYEIFVVDPAYRPIGTVPLYRVMRSKRPTKISDIMNTEQTLIRVDTDREEVARLFEKYDLISAAVIDENDRLVGVTTVDDIVEVISEEATEDIRLMGGIVNEEAVGDSVALTARNRFSWLFVNLLTAILASVVIGLFDATIEQMVALAVLMPIVASMGGNAGTQTMTVAVRSLATRELGPLNALRFMRRELMVGVVNGILFALLIGAVGGVWFQDAMLGVVLGAAMIVNMVVAAVSGILVPMALDRMNIDPAVASSVFVTTMTDVVGFFAFLGLAAIWLM
ncbi:magnesium transporter [Tepidicaulis marinus]|uniref:Magnesium transporter MgtE n=1 Tax=Tepidicaulis marinus TaxID=1333998 RepID=A0A081BEC2_9HYPH|nr:magnesium transporter [Tepidicaulis marinus]GAK46390.1 magnesium transporter [Tepidicaulis marinus]